MFRDSKRVNKRKAVSFRKTKRKTKKIAKKSLLLQTFRKKDKRAVRLKRSSLPKEERRRGRRRHTVTQRRTLRPKDDLWTTQRGGERRRRDCPRVLPRVVVVAAREIVVVFAPSFRRPIVEEAATKSFSTRGGRRSPLRPHRHRRQPRRSTHSRRARWMTPITFWMRTNAGAPPSSSCGKTMVVRGEEPSPPRFGREVEREQEQSFPIGRALCSEAGIVGPLGKIDVLTTNKLNAMIAPASPIEKTKTTKKKRKKSERIRRRRGRRTEVGERDGVSREEDARKYRRSLNKSSDPKIFSLTKLEKEEETTKTTSTCNQIGRDNVRIATNENDFEVVANLRATAFYDDLTERQALPFPPRFTPTFHRVCTKGEEGIGREGGEVDVVLRKVRVLGCG